MAMHFLEDPSLNNLALLLIAVASLAASLFWLRQVFKTRTRAYLGNTLSIFFTIVGGTTWLCFLVTTKNWGEIPAAFTVIAFGVLLLRKLPKELVLG